jgi:outer membrane protein OmpA-like peptidoglycan-associated protein
LAFAVAGLGAAVAVAQPSPSSAPAATVSFDPQSVELSAATRGVLDGLAKTLIDGGRPIELRAYGSGDEPAEARKLALARALAVRSYLIDRGVRVRIEVNATAAPARNAPRERVDVIVQ